MANIERMVALFCLPKYFLSQSFMWNTVAEIIWFLIGIVIIVLLFGVFIRIFKNLQTTFQQIFKEFWWLIGTSKKDESIFWEYINYLYKKDYLMTKRENEFFRHLCDYIKDKDYLVCPKVRLEDIVWVRSTKNWFRPWKASSRLDRAHVDFLLIGKTDYVSKFAIELDDSTHDNNYGKEHDRAKNEAFEKVWMPILRFRNSSPTHEEFASIWI